MHYMFTSYASHFICADRHSNFTADKIKESRNFEEGSRSVTLKSQIKS